MQAHKVNLQRFWVSAVGQSLNGKISQKPEYGSCSCLDLVGLVRLYFSKRLAALLVVGLHMKSAGTTPVRQHRKVRLQL
jgi:hypothetical protein